MIFCSAGLLRLARHVHRARQRDLAGGLAIAHALAGGAQHLAVLDLDGGGLHVPRLGRDRDERGPRIGAGEAQRRAAELDRRASRRSALVRRLPRIAGDEHEPLRRDVELVAGDLAHGGQHALAQFDAAGHHRDGAVGGDAHPGVELGIASDHGRHRRAGRPAVPWAAAQRKPMVRPATAETAPMPKARRLRVMSVLIVMASHSPAGGALHGANDALLAAAAAQVGVHVLADLRLLGLGLSASRAAASMIMPLVQ